MCTVVNMQGKTGNLYGTTNVKFRLTMEPSLTFFISISSMMSYFFRLWFFLSNVAVPFTICWFAPDFAVFSICYFFSMFLSAFLYSCHSCLAPDIAVWFKIWLSCSLYECFVQNIAVLAESAVLFSFCRLVSDYFFIFSSLLSFGL